MSETFWIIGEIIIGIALLGLLSAVVTAVMVPRLNKLDKHVGPAAILGERYARGELTREQYAQMRQDLGIGVGVGEGLSAPTVDARDLGAFPGKRSTS
jgi:uncharacterized membrane protein